MLQIAHETRPGYGDIDLSKAEVGDVLYAVGFSSYTPMMPIWVRRYTVTNVLKVAVDLMNAQGKTERVSRKQHFERASLETQGVQWARDIIRKSRRAHAGQEFLQKVWQSGQFDLLDAEILDALDAWRARHGLQTDAEKEAGARAAGNASPAP